VNRSVRFYQLSAIVEKRERTLPSFTKNKWLSDATLLGIVAIHFVLGGIGALALPPLGLWPGLVSLAFSFAIARHYPLKRSFVAGFALGFGYFALALHWIGYAFLVDAQTFLWMMPFAVGGLAAFLAIYWGLAFMGARVLMTLRVPWFAAYPACLFAFEFLRGTLFTGFPWAEPGLAAERMGGVLQVASVIGMQGLTFWLLLWAGLSLAFVNGSLPRKRAKAAALLLLALLPVAHVWGQWRSNAVSDATVEGVRLLLVQPNLSQDDKWQADNAGAIFQDLLQMSNVEGDKPTHIIWPESAVPFLVDENAGAKAEIARLLEPGQILLTGAVRREIAPSTCANCPEDYFTSILMYDDTGTLRGTYDKWRLVPGGEFLPMAWLLEPLGFRKVVNVPESFTAGAGARSLDVPGAGLAGFLICYEVIFPQGLIDQDQRPAFLINVTNDAWFGLSTGPHQHLAQARMRAVEQNLPLVRTANSGISAVIDGKGHFLNKSELGVKTVLQSKLPIAGPPTAFARFGLWIAIASIFMALLLVIYWCNKPLNTQSD
jgi:apolipoprotein N-acyltransferase